MEDTGKQAGWQPKTGRRTKLTRELLHEITARLAGGLYFETACRLCGVTPRSGFAWLAKAREIEGRFEDTEDDPTDAEEALFLQFLHAVDSAKAEAEARSVLGIRDAAKTDWRAHAWYLERTRPDQYGAKERHVHEFSRSNDERFVAEAARLFGGAFAASVSEALEVSPQDDNNIEAHDPG